MPQLSESPYLHEGASVHGSQLGRYTEIGVGTRLQATVMGDYSYTDRFCDIANCQIGKFANIASFVRLNPGNHPTQRASQHHFQYRASMYWPDEADEQAFFEWRASQPVVIGHDTWIGNGALVMAGRSVGDGAVIGAGAIVTRDVPAYEIWAGNPARKIRDRFAPEIGERLRALAWWDWSHDALRAALDDFRALEVSAFLEKYGG
ncbi:MAG: chloramphenicol acetyltransferase [Neomegalonema sp.]|nr:chloramphenicol acetyltransferase [Neomegalonema sp.]